MAAISVDARRRTRPSVRTCCGTLLVPVNARCTADSAALRQAARCSRTTSSIRSVRSFKLVVVVMRLQSHATSPASTGALNGYAKTRADGLWRLGGARAPESDGGLQRACLTPRYQKRSPPRSVPLTVPRLVSASPADIRRAATRHARKARRPWRCSRQAGLAIFRTESRSFTRTNRATWGSRKCRGPGSQGPLRALSQLPWDVQAYTQLTVAGP